MKKVKKYQKGFTFVEVLVTIGMVGILFLPMLTFFSRSVKVNQNSKNMQRENEVAASIIEQVRSYDTIENMVDFASSNDDFELKSKPAQNASHKLYTFQQKNIQNDGVNYIADIKVDFGDKTKLATNDGYRNYGKLNAAGLPAITSLGAGSTIMAEEGKADTSNVITEYQQNYQYKSHGKDISADEIARHLKKTIEVEIVDTQLDAAGKDLLSANMVHINVYGKYYLDKSSVGSGDDAILKDIANSTREKVTTLYNGNVVLDKLKGMYIFYQYDITNSDSVDIFQGINVNMQLNRTEHQEWNKMTDGGINPLNKITIYALCQGITNVEDSMSDSITGDEMDAYAEQHQKRARFTKKLTIYTKGTFDNTESIQFFSNFSYSVNGTPIGTKNKMGDIVPNEIIDRMAYVEVTVYREDEAAKDGITMTTTRGE